MGAARQLSLPVHGAPFDLLTSIMHLGSAHTKANKVKGLLLGATVLGPDTMQYSQGWWHYVQQPVPMTFEELRHTKQCMCGLPKKKGDSTPSPLEVMKRRCPAEWLDAEAQQRFGTIGLGWDWFYIAALPTFRCVKRAELQYTSRDGKRRVKWRSARFQLATYGAHEYARRLPEIRAALERHLGVRHVLKPSDITDNLRHTVDHWYRAACALLSYGSGSGWFDSIQRMMAEPE
jgi:hypothetical protein